MRSQTIENPLVSPFRQSFEPSLAELAQARRQYNRGIADSLRDSIEDIDTPVSMLKGIDDLRGNRLYEQALEHFDKALRLLDEVAFELEVG